MRSTLTLALCLVAALAAASAEAKTKTKAMNAPPIPIVAPAAAAAPATPAAAAPQPIRLRVTLKDGQQADVTLSRYDSVFLSVVNARGTSFDLPWLEVAAVSGDDLGPDLGLMQGRITKESYTVTSQLADKDPGKALSQAFWPGILLHGAGHRYAGDQDTFFSLAGGELFGIVVGGFGLSEVLGPEKKGESKDTALALAASGGAIFALTWAWDLCFAPGAARKTNQARGLSLEPLPQGAQLAYRF